MSSDPDQTYTLEIVAKLTGVASETILHYQEHGLVKPVEPDHFDDNAIHALRRIEHLRQTCEVNLSGVKLIFELMNEVEQLRSQLRSPNRF